MNKTQQGNRGLMTFLITWITATLLLLWLGDHNIYVVYSPSHNVIKDHLSFAGQVLDSLLFGGLFSACNTVLLRGCYWLRGRKSATAAHTPPQPAEQGRNPEASSETESASGERKRDA